MTGIFLRTNFAKNSGSEMLQGCLEIGLFIFEVAASKMSNSPSSSYSEQKKTDLIKNLLLKYFKVVLREQGEFKIGINTHREVMTLVFEKSMYGK